MEQGICLHLARHKGVRATLWDQRATTLDRA